MSKEMTCQTQIVVWLLPMCNTKKRNFPSDVSDDATMTRCRNRKGTILWNKTLLIHAYRVFLFNVVFWGQLCFSANIYFLAMCRWKQAAEWTQGPCTHTSSHSTGLFLGQEDRQTDRQGKRTLLMVQGTVCEKASWIMEANEDEKKGSGSRCLKKKKINSARGERSAEGSSGFSCICVRHTRP